VPAWWLDRLFAADRGVFAALVAVDTSRRRSDGAMHRWMVIEREKRTLLPMTDKWAHRSVQPDIALNLVAYLQPLLV
jgi:hypothetical protein